MDIIKDVKGSEDLIDTMKDLDYQVASTEVRFKIHTQLHMSQVKAREPEETVLLRLSKKGNSSKESIRSSIFKFRKSSVNNFQLSSSAKSVSANQKPRASIAVEPQFPSLADIKIASSSLSISEMFSTCDIVEE